jgi:hypothetical protein
MESVYHFPALFATRVEVVWKLVGLRARKVLLDLLALLVRRDNKVRRYFLPRAIGQEETPTRGKWESLVISWLIS